MLNTLIPWLPAIALIVGMLICFGVRHYLDVKDFNSRDGRKQCKRLSTSR